MSLTIVRDGERVTLTGAEADAFETSREPTLDQLKQRKREQVNRHYAATLETGVSWNGVRWTATDAARDTLVELHETAQELSESVTVLDATNTAHTLSAAQLSDLRAAGRLYRHQARENRLALLGQIEAATDKAELDAVDPSSGWPS